MTEHVVIVDSPYIAELNVDLPLGTKLYATPMDVESLRPRLAEIEKQEPVGYAPITDSQWVNIANANQANEAVEEAIKLVEEKAAENNIKLYAAPVVSPDVAALKAELTELKSHNKLIMDMYVQYSDENQSLKTELVNWKSRCEHRVADIQLQAKRVVDLEATMRSLNTELEAARKDAARRRKYAELYSERYGVPESDVSDEIDAAIERAKGDVLDACKKAP